MDTSSYPKTRSRASEAEMQTTKLIVLRTYGNKQEASSFIIVDAHKQSKICSQKAEWYSFKIFATFPSSITELRTSAIQQFYPFQP